MMRRAQRAVVLLLLVGGASAGMAGPAEERFREGNLAYEAGRFADAAAAYRDVLSRGVEDPRVHFNLANSEFKLGHLGASILGYERARALDPSDPEIVENLRYVRTFCADRVEPEGTPSGVFALLRGRQNRIGPDPQVWGVLALLWAAAAIVAWCTARPGGWTPLWGWVLSGVLVVVLALGSSWYFTWQRTESRDLAVVLAAATDIRSGPGPNHATLATVHEGLTVEVRVRREGWVHVRLPNGISGWVASGAVEEV